MVGLVNSLGSTILFWTITGILTFLFSIPFGWWMIGRVNSLGCTIGFSGRLSVLDCNPEPPYIFGLDVPRLPVDVVAVDDTSLFACNPDPPKDGPTIVPNVPVDTPPVVVPVPVDAPASAGIKPNPLPCASVCDMNASADAPAPVGLKPNSLPFESPCDTTDLSLLIVP